MFVISPRQECQKILKLFNFAHISVSVWIQLKLQYALQQLLMCFHCCFSLLSYLSDPFRGRKTGVPQPLPVFLKCIGISKSQANCKLDQAGQCQWSFLIRQRRRIHRDLNEMFCFALDIYCGCLFCRFCFLH